MFSYLVNLSHRYVDVLDFSKNQFPSLKHLSCSQSFATICIATVNNLVHSLLLLLSWWNVFVKAESMGTTICLHLCQHSVLSNFWIYVWLVKKYHNVDLICFKWANLSIFLKNCISFYCALKFLFLDIYKWSPSLWLLGAVCILRKPCVIWVAIFFSLSFSNI